MIAVILVQSGTKVSSSEQTVIACPLGFQATVYLASVWQCLYEKYDQHDRAWTYTPQVGIPEGAGIICGCFASILFEGKCEDAPRQSSVLTTQVRLDFEQCQESQVLWESGLRSLLADPRILRV